MAAAYYLENFWVVNADRGTQVDATGFPELENITESSREFRW